MRSFDSGVKRIAVSVEHVRGWGRRVCEGIADYLHGHPEWRISMFERVLGTTVQREIMSARIAAAEHLLKTTALPIATIAARSGFKSVQYFNHCFSARHHLSPGEWRKQK